MRADCFLPVAGKATEQVSGRMPIMFVKQTVGRLASIAVVLWSVDAKTHQSFATSRSRSLIDQTPKIALAPGRQGCNTLQLPSDEWP